MFLKLEDNDVGDKMKKIKEKTRQRVFIIIYFIIVFLVF